uniref:Putative pectate lyase n=1 Tax=viral metagenome TaxID=1070528 RepID=A0A6M3IF65_9ZZZZ
MKRPTADVTSNNYIRDIVGNKSDTYRGAVATSRSLMSYIKSLVLNQPVGPPAPDRVRMYVNKLMSASGVGTSWDTAYKTIAEAITAANATIDWGASPWAPGIEIHIALGSYAEALTSLPYGCTMIGHGDAWDADGENGVRIKPASGVAVDVNSMINTKIKNINFEVVGATKVFDAAIMNNVLFEHCRFAGPPEATTATVGLYTTDSVMVTVRDCRFEYLDCGIECLYDSSGDIMVRWLIDRNFFTWISEAGIRFGGTDLLVRASHIFQNMIHGGGETLAVGIDDNSGDESCGVFGNYINATDDIQGVSTNVGGNYIGGSSIE